MESECGFCLIGLDFFDNPYPTSTPFSGGDSIFVEAWEGCVVLFRKISFRAGGRGKGG